MAKQTPESDHTLRLSSKQTHKKPKQYLLVGLFVPKSWVGIQGIAEGTVESRSVLGCIGHDRGVCVTYRVQRLVLYCKCKCKCKIR